ncbi:MAG: hypothetical protein IPF99_35360 [Deltaproteobacteria bacterium]|nr:hypothetical protein [Deltaproteobacteria bacterium]
MLEITGHGDVGVDGKYLVLRVDHTGVVPETIAGRTQHDGGEQERYRNEFQCIPVDVPYRPERKTRKPRVFGMQTATVVGPEGGGSTPTSTAG